MVLIRGEVELLGTDVDVSGKDVVGDDVLDEGGLVVLLFIIDLGAVQGNLGHEAEAVGQLVVAVHKDGKVEAAAEIRQRFDGLAGKKNGDLILSQDHNPGQLGQLDPNLVGIGAGHDGALGVNDADLAVGGGLHLLDHVGKDVVRHIDTLLSAGRFCKLLPYIIPYLSDFFKTLLAFSLKICRIFYAKTQQNRRFI